MRKTRSGCTVGTFEKSMVYQPEQSEIRMDGILMIDTNSLIVIS